MSETYQPASEFETESGTPSNEFDENQANTPSQSASSAQKWAELAEKWASEEENVVVEGGKFSALHYAAKAEAANALLENGNIAANSGEQVLNLYNAGMPAIFASNFEGELLCNPTEGSDFFDMSNWISRKLGDGKLVIEDGFHSVNGHMDLRAGHHFQIEGKRTPDLLKIVGISYANVSGTTRRATITLDPTTPLPEHVVDDYAVSIQFPSGDGDAKACSGTALVKIISIDRLTFSFDFYCPKELTSPTTLDYTAIYSMAANTVVVPPACIYLDEAGWDGAAVEGAFNIHSGASMRGRWLGLSHDGVGGGEHDTILVNGGYLGIEDYFAIGGGGDALIRIVSGGEVNLNRFTGGGANKARQGIYSQMNGYTRTSRCNFGGFPLFSLNLGQRSAAYFALCRAVSSGQILYVLGNSVLDFVSADVSHGVRGLYAVGGRTMVGANAYIEDCTSFGADILSGDIVGSPIFGTGDNANTTDIQATPNTEYRGGEWQKDSMMPVTSGAQQTLILANNTFKSALITGNTGRIRFLSNIAPEDGFEIEVDGNSSDVGIVYQGSDVIAATGDISLVSNPLNISFSVWDDNGDIRIQVKNEDAGTRRFDVYVEGAIALETFS